MSGACAVDCKNVLGEGAVWCPQEQLLWWIDISTRRSGGSIRARRASITGRSEAARSFALRKNGGFLFAFRNGFATLDAPGGELGLARAPGAEARRRAFNDGKVDRAGRFWAGTLDRKLGAAIGQLYRVEPGSA